MKKYSSKINRSLLGAAMLALLAPAGYAGHTNNLLVAEMDGREEVGTDPTQRLVGDPDGKGIGYVFGIDGDEFTLCYSLIVNNIQLVPVGEGMAAHIHEGIRDTNGPVVAVLAGPEDGNAADCLTEGEEGKFPTGESGIVQRILNNPTDFYINIHNPEFPAGAIRGNLANTLPEGEHSHTHGVPSVPTNVSSAVYSSTAAELFWDRSSDDGIVIGYEVIRNGDMFDMADGNSYFDNTLEPGVTYQYQFIAVDDEGNRSGASNSVEVVTQ